VKRSRALNISLLSAFAIMLYCGLSFGLLMNANDIIRMACQIAVLLVTLSALIIALVAAGIVSRIAISVLAAPLIHLILASVVFNAYEDPGNFPTSSCLQSMWEVVKRPIEVEESPMPTAKELVARDRFGWHYIPMSIPDEEAFIEIGLCLFSIFLGMISGLFVWAFRERSTSTGQG